MIDKLVALDRESQSGGAVLPSDVESVKRLRTRLEEARKSTLESFRLALLDGEVLIEKLTAMKETGTLDSRPAQILPAINAGRNFRMILIRVLLDFSDFSQIYFFNFSRSYWIFFEFFGDLFLKLIFINLP